MFRHVISVETGSCNAKSTLARLLARNSLSLLDFVEPNLLKQNLKVKKLVKSEKNKESIK